MLCPSCNNHVDDSCSFCPHCGAKMEKSVDPFEPTQPINPSQPASQNRSFIDTQDNIIAIIGFVLAFFAPAIGLVCSIIGYSNSKTDGKNRNYAIAGIAVSAVEIALSVIAIIVVSALFIWGLSMTWM